VANEPRARLSVAAGQRITLVDSSVILDIVTEDPAWAAWSADALAQARDDGLLVINPIVYAEVSTGFDRIEDLDDGVPAEDFQREALPYEAGFVAGKAFLTYRRRGGQKRSPLPNFYIGAHAAVRRYRLLTRDVARYRTYFPTVKLIAPEPERPTGEGHDVPRRSDHPDLRGHQPGPAHGNGTAATKGLIFGR
jgi:predicted nucleic acid-binding protein